MSVTSLRVQGAETGASFNLTIRNASWRDEVIASAAGIVRILL